MQKVEYIETSDDQKLNYAWNCSNHYGSIQSFNSSTQGKSRNTKYRHKKNAISKFKKKKTNLGTTGHVQPEKLNFKKYENYLRLTQHGSEKARGWNGTSSIMVTGEGSFPVWAG